MDTAKKVTCPTKDTVGELKPSDRTIGALHSLGHADLQTSAPVSARPLGACYYQSGAE